MFQVQVLMKVEPKKVYFGIESPFKWKSGRSVSFHHLARDNLIYVGDVNSAELLLDQKPKQNSVCVLGLSYCVFCPFDKMVISPSNIPRNDKKCPWQGTKTESQIWSLGYNICC